MIDLDSKERIASCWTYRLCSDDGMAAGFCAHAREWTEGVVGEDVDSLNICVSKYVTEMDAILVTVGMHILYKSVCICGARTR